MLSTPEPDLRTKYLLGELDQEEQRGVEERYFADDQYFNELLRLEDDLLGQDVEARIHSLTTERTRNPGSLTNIERLPEIEFTRQWLSDVRELITATDQHEEGLGSTGAVADDSNALLISALIDFYEGKLQNADLATKRQQSEKLLAAASRDREFASTLMENGGLGLRVLAALKAGSQFEASSLAASLEPRLDTIIPVLVRLVQFGGIKEEGGLFSITERGSEVIRNLEAATASSL